MSIDQKARYLHLPYIRDSYKLLADEARLKDLSYEDYLDELLEGESLSRKNNAIKKKTRDAKFPYILTFDEFKTEHLSIEIKQKIKQLETLNFIDYRENIILVGNPGTGKTALSIALGCKACLANRSVLFISVPQLLIEINEAMSKSQYLKYQSKFEKYDLVILDELGYSSFSKDSGEILFNLLSKRNDVGSLIITSNLTMDKWDEVFKDKVLTGAIVDRLANRAHMIDMSGESYRIKQTMEWLKEDVAPINEKLGK